MSADAVERRVVAIDGPGGSGKSTVARRVAAETGLEYLDTGAMYRAITHGVLSRGVDPADWAAIDGVLRSIEIDLDASSVTVDRADATAAIRGAEVTAHVSAVAANPTVRQAMVGLQRRWLVDRGGGVLEGRDIGTVVVPDAGLKVFLTASVGERARRRALETGEDERAVEADLVRRDALDSERTDSPMCAAADAVEIDTTGLTIDEVVDRIVGLARDRGLV